MSPFAGGNELRCSVGCAIEGDRELAGLDGEAQCSALGEK